MTGLAYELIYTIPTALTAGYMILNAAGYESSGFGFYGITVFFSLLCAFFFNFGKRGKAVMAGTAVSLAAGFMFLYDKEERLSILRDHIMILWVLLICILSYLMIKIIKRFHRLIQALGLCYAAFLVIMLITGNSLPKAVAAAAIFITAVSAAEEVQRRWKKEGYTESARHLVNAAPFILAVLIAAFSFDMPSKPYDWHIVRSIAEGVMRGYENICRAFMPPTGWDGEDTVIGFSERGALTGQVREDTYMAIEVSSDRRIDERLYFSGKTFDTFDGRNWEKVDAWDMDYQALDTVEILSAVLKETEEGEGIADYLKKAQAFVTYEGLNTHCMFIPQKTYKIMSERETYCTGGDRTYAGRRDKQYSVYFYQTNRSHPLFAKMVSDRTDIDRGTWNKALGKAGLLKDPNCTYDKYLQYLEHIEDVYAGDVTLSDEMRDHLAELFAGEDDDMRKLELIEKELSGMHYTDNPGAIPEDVDSAGEFLDYFVLEKREGFCTYFATAFVLLARSQGIPARYVQGYSKSVRDRKAFRVMSNDAHAWGEAYIEGVGWIPFEPTPGYKKDALWETADETSVSAEVALSANGMEGVSVSSDNEAEDKTGGGELGWQMVLIPTLSGLVFAGLFLAGDAIYRKRRYNKMSERGKIISVCRKGLVRLERAHGKREQGETLLEYRRRLGEDVPPESVRLIEIYEDISYSNKSFDDASEAERLLKITERYSRRKRFEGFINHFQRKT